MTVENLLLPLDFLKCLFLQRVTSHREAEHLSTSETHRCFFFPWPVGWLTRQRNRATESSRKGDREKKPEVWRDREEDTVQAEGCHIWEQREGKRGRHDIREKQMPGDKKARVRDRWREQEHNIRIRWQPEVIFAYFHGCTGLSSM